MTPGEAKSLQVWQLLNRIEDYRRDARDALDRGESAAALEYAKILQAYATFLVVRLGD